MRAKVCNSFFCKLWLRGFEGFVASTGGKRNSNSTFDSKETTMKRFATLTAITFALLVAFVSTADAGSGWTPRGGGGGHHWQPPTPPPHWGQPPTCVQPPVHPPVYRPIHPPIYQPVRPPVRPPVYRPVPPPVYRPTFPPTCHGGGGGHTTLPIGYPTSRH